MITPYARGAVRVVLDNTGVPFSPDSCAHAYVWDVDGYLETDTATDPKTGLVRVKTFTWSAGKLATETGWIAQ